MTDNALMVRKPHKLAITNLTIQSAKSYVDMMLPPSPFILLPATPTKYR